MGIPLIKKLDINSINTSIIAIRKLLENVGITEQKVIVNNNYGGGMPLGTWVSFENDTAPNTEWIKAGTNFDAATFPDLLALLHGNMVPYRYDHNRPSEWENINLSSNSSSPTVMEYDGNLIINGNGHAQRNIKAYVNNKEVYVADGYSGLANEWSSATIPFKYGDEIYLSYTSSTQPSEVFSYVSYFKHPLFIKANN